MIARMDRLPPNAKMAKGQPKKRKAKSRGTVVEGTWRCGGPRGCGEVITGRFTLMEKHLDAHGGGRAEAVFEIKGGQ
jgi:hypothetical protein